MQLYKDDYGKSVFQGIGILSSQLPSYVRHCCRSLYDGTDEEVLDAFRETAYIVLKRHKDEYNFVQNHMTVLRQYTPEMVKEMILANPSKKVVNPCLAISTPNGLPKRNCLHCPNMSQWIKIMMNYRRKSDDGTINESWK